MIRKDWELIKRLAAEAGRSRDSITLGDSTFMHICTSSNEEEAKAAFSKISALSFDRVKAYYLVGSPSTVADKLKESLSRIPEISHVIPTPITFEEEQLELLAREVIPQI